MDGRTAQKWVHAHAERRAHVDLTDDWLAHRHSDQSMCVAVDLRTSDVYAIKLMFESAGAGRRRFHRNERPADWPSPRDLARSTPRSASTLRMRHVFVSICSSRFVSDAACVCSTLSSDNEMRASTPVSPTAGRAFCELGRRRRKLARMKPRLTIGGTAKIPYR